jgi:hypothetical protein
MKCLDDRIEYWTRAKQRLINARNVVDEEIATQLAVKETVVSKHISALSFGAARTGLDTMRRIVEMMSAHYSPSRSTGTKTQDEWRTTIDALATRLDTDITHVVEIVSEFAVLPLHRSPFTVHCR